MPTTPSDTISTQADALLQRLNAPATDRSAWDSSTPVVAVTGGKGGIGKSTIAANLAIATARGGRRPVAPRVLLVDCDFGLASLDAILDLPRRRTVAAALEGNVRIEDLLIAGPSGIDVMLAPRGLERYAQLDAQKRAMVLSVVRKAARGHDLAVLDLPAGIHADGLTLAHAADLQLVVATPDPASVADAYAVVKIARDRSPGSRLGFAINEAPGPVEARQLSERFAAVVRRFLGIEIEYFGWIPRDAAVQRATANRRPVVLAEPASPAAASLRLLAGRVMNALDRMGTAAPALSSAIA